MLNIFFGMPLAQQFWISLEVSSEPFLPVSSIISRLYSAAGSSQHRNFSFFLFRIHGGKHPRLSGKRRSCRALFFLACIFQIFFFPPPTIPTLRLDAISSGEASSVLVLLPIFVKLDVVLCVPVSGQISNHHFSVLMFEHATQKRRQLGDGRLERENPERRRYQSMEVVCKKKKILLPKKKTGCVLNSAIFFYQPVLLLFFFFFFHTSEKRKEFCLFTS